ncbi:PREDICTED: keratin-associated protein 5-5-like [Branchiostoma belcheri]|uniref:Keratin-associated protein 5-5-like n=1 Tax=Branchiostoma belcheri TaxID=7741 RepID=A0A6P4ZAA8_BRABE|nr:PREDICTED: keratin-associated protein 5-5-like [Branchiostoma belcheri]
MSPLTLVVLCFALVFPGPSLAAEGQCTAYKRGGLLHMKHYVCCDNCGENDGAPDCGQTTYLADSTERDYCGSCGEDLGDARETVGMFGCGGCTGQAIVSHRCDKRYVYAGASFCWLHSKCFELRCQKVAQDAALESSPTDQPYCGDSHCDKHREDAASCPFDCCPLRNPDECRHPYHCSKCPPLCCAETGCCLD